MTFVDWLLLELEKQDLSQSEFARRSGIARTHVSRVISRNRFPGFEFYKKTATAFNLPLEEVLRRAGELSPDYSEDPELDGLMQHIQAIPPAARPSIFDLIYGILGLVRADHDLPLFAETDPAYSSSPPTIQTLPDLTTWLDSLTDEHFEQAAAAFELTFSERLGERSSTRHSASA